MRLCWSAVHDRRYPGRLHQLSRRGLRQVLPKSRRDLCVRRSRRRLPLEHPGGALGGRLVLYGEEDCAERRRGWGGGALGGAALVPAARGQRSHSGRQTRTRLGSPMTIDQSNQVKRLILGNGLVSDVETLKDS